MISVSSVRQAPLPASPNVLQGRKLIASSQSIHAGYRVPGRSRKDHNRVRWGLQVPGCLSYRLATPIQMGCRRGVAQQAEAKRCIMQPSLQTLVQQSFALGPFQQSRGRAAVFSIRFGLCVLLLGNIVQALQSHLVSPFSKCILCQLQIMLQIQV